MTEYIFALSETEEELNKCADGDWPKIIEVVRCKDCKHLRQGEYGLRCEYMGCYTEEDNFCKWGERKEE